jgi:hypothetical protein
MAMNLYSFATPNARRACIALEEAGTGDTLERIDLIAGRQHNSGFGKISPVEKLLVLVDAASRRDPVRLGRDCAPRRRALGNAPARRSGRACEGVGMVHAGGERSILGVECLLLDRQFSSKAITAR